MTHPPSVLKAAPLLLLFGAALALAGCGAASPAYPPEPPLPSTTEGSLAALDQAEGELMLALGGPASPMATAAPGAGAPGLQGAYAQPPPPPTEDRSASPAQPSVSPPSGDASSAKEAEIRSGRTASDPCSSACRALQSMRRATEHLCSLSSEVDARCQGARERVKSAGERVRSFCPACSAAHD